jgi:hypothetical protein
MASSYQQERSKKIMGTLSQIGIPSNSNKNKTYTKYKKSENNVYSCSRNTKCSQNRSKKNNKEKTKNQAYKHFLLTKLKKYKKKLIDILKPGIFSFNKNYSLQEIELIADYLKILNHICNDTKCNIKDSFNTDIYNYLKTKLKSELKSQQDEININAFIDTIRYNKPEPDKTLNNSLYNIIKKNFKTIIENIPECK